MCLKINLKINSFSTSDAMNLFFKQFAGRPVDVEQQTHRWGRMAVLAGSEAARAGLLLAFQPWSRWISATRISLEITQQQKNLSKLKSSNHGTKKICHEIAQLQKLEIAQLQMRPKCSSSCLYAFAARRHNVVSARPRHGARAAHVPGPTQQCGFAAWGALHS